LVVDGAFWSGQHGGDDEFWRLTHFFLEAFSSGYQLSTKDHQHPSLPRFSFATRAAACQHPAHPIFMSCLRSKFRHLYLLALFQLVGGPLVLVPMLLISKAAVRETAQHGVVKGFHQAMVSQEWEEVREMLQDGEVSGTSSSTKAPGKQEKSKDGNAKLNFMVWTSPAHMKLEGVPVKQPAWEWQPMASSWANAPPSPPPRVA
jgi:hypothetical protein